MCIFVLCLFVCVSVCVCDDDYAMLRIFCCEPHKRCLSVCVASNKGCLLCVHVVVCACEPNIGLNK